MVIKVISLGFFKAENAYLRSKWNIFDFMVVIISICSLIFPQAQFLKSLRSIRILQLLSRFSETRVAVKAIGRAIPAVSNVFIIMLLCWYIFAIVGVTHLLAFSISLLTGQYLWGSILVLQ